MAIVHIVLFGFDAGADPAVAQDVCQRMLDLKDKCLHPTTEKPYIRSSIGGRDNSIEGMQDGVTHAFVVEFENKKDRDYYVEKDPAHRAFVQSLAGVVSKAQVVDFSPGVTQSL